MNCSERSVACFPNLRQSPSKRHGHCSSHQSAARYVPLLLFLATEDELFPSYCQVNIALEGSKIDPQLLLLFESLILTFNLPLLVVIPELRRAEAHLQLFDSLDNLNRVVNDVFGQISSRVRLQLESTFQSA